MIPQLRALARRYGVQTTYYDIAGQRCQARPEALLAVLRSLGAPIERPEDVAAALRQHRLAHWERGVDPVAVAWGGGPVRFKLRLPARRAEGLLRCRLTLETGEVRSWNADLRLLPTIGGGEVEGRRYVAKRFRLAGQLPLGYHRLTLTAGKQAFEILIIAAPESAYTPDEEWPGGRAWGVFLPLYALRSRRNWGIGDLTDLDTLVTWTAGLGGRVVGTLPLLAAFLDEPFEPSPYCPASRLFWNELYIDVLRIPDLESCPGALEHARSTSLRAAIARLNRAPLVDYREVARLKRQVLEELARCFFARGGDESPEYRRFLERHPQVQDYARFRAVLERHRAPWGRWPASLQHGALADDDYAPEVQNYHLYAQWIVHEQLRALAEKARQTGTRLYLDLPLGVHPDSYDVWRERELFARDASAGAPPDPFFTRGQNWGFPPLNPRALREQRYRYTIACLRSHLQYAGILRLDHVMSLHRLFWVPLGFDPVDGVYVRYPADELYAILCLESHRHRALIVGEDLGTVSRAVRATMERRRIQRMHVVQFEIAPGADPPLPPVPEAAVAALNTHDMAPFAGFWQGADIRDRLQFGHLDDADARVAETQRQALREALIAFLRRTGTLGDAETPDAVLRAILAHLASSPGRLLLVNLEDLWLETRSQNVPGTAHEHPNWRRKARFAIEEFCNMPDVLAALNHIQRLRHASPSDHHA